MLETSHEQDQHKSQEEDDSTLTGQVRGVLHAAIDYLGSTLSLVQARLAELVLSSAVFIALLAISLLLAIAALIMANVALGMWLTQLTGHVGWSLLILSGAYALVSWGLIAAGLRWLRKLRS